MSRNSSRLAALLVTILIVVGAGTALQSIYGGAGGAAAVPEPSTLVSALLALAGVAVCRARQEVA